MTCRFLENISLRSLIAPTTEEEFRSRYWEREPLVISRQDPEYYGDLFTLQDFDEAITRTPDYVKLANASSMKNKSYKPSHARGLESLLEDMRGGSTLVLDQLHNSEPKLGRLCRLLGPQLGHRLQTNLYLTPPQGKGFTPHWDNHDVFVLQVLGSKKWNIERSRRVYPNKGDKMGDDGRDLRGDVHSFTLSQGDLIYIPRGFVHAAECDAAPSLHITLGVIAVFFEEFLFAAVKAATLRDERLRAAMPLGFMQDNPKSVIDRAVAAFRDLADENLLGQVMDQFRDELVKTFPLDISGQVVDFFQPRPIALDTTISPRLGIVYQTHLEASSVRLNFGARSIVFPDFFAEALNYVLSKTKFLVRDLPGDLADQERIAFIERLLQEGLVARS